MHISIEISSRKMLIKVVDDVAITQRKSGLLHFRNNSESCKNVKQCAEKISETHAVRDKADILVRRYCAVNISCFISCKCFLFDFLLVVLGCNPFTMVHLINFSFFRCLFSLYQVNECPNIWFVFYLRIHPVVPSFHVIVGPMHIQTEHVPLLWSQHPCYSVICDEVIDHVKGN